MNQLARRNTMGDINILEGLIDRDLLERIKEDFQRSKDAAFSTVSF